MAFGLFRKPVPEPAAPVVATKAAQSAKAIVTAEPMAEPDSAREILELLDLELGGLIRQLERAAQSVAGGAQSTAATLATIRERTDALSGRSSAARSTATSFAEVSDKFTRSAEGIGAQVRDAADRAPDDAPRPQFDN
jgi:methyl-accepting chemotaxis protein